MSRRDSTDETEPFLPRPSASEPIEPPLRTAKSVLIRLYISHSLSAWNSRMFEFGAVLFLASIYPDTLLYASIYALIRSLSAVLLSSWLGSVVDRSNRLNAIRHSIIWQRLPVALSCACFMLLSTPSELPYLPPLLFGAVTLLACLEKLASAANTVAIERDWAIVISDALQIPKQELNASMRRIDLICKLLAPIVISSIDSFSTQSAISTTMAMTASSVLIEYIAIAHVYKSVPELARTQSPDPPTPNRTAAQYAKSAIDPWREYTASPLFPASLALSLLYLTVLSFGPTMITYLLHTGFTGLQISSMRMGAVIAELAGTWAAPCITSRIGPVRSGLWFLNWQFGSLAAAIAVFAFRDGSSQLAAGCLVAGVALSRVGLWGFDLSVQLLVQETIKEQTRSRFSSTEIALQSILEMLSFATTVAFPLPGQFQYAVYISYGAVGTATVCFAAYVRRERGHLLHTGRCLGGEKLWGRSG
ncbi:Ferroporti-1 [Aspergillus coremiiformis]|uniref:Solute carrier family 40 member n=1 Tax=Aspergillus coremiiformis TaxID=138285 RepID=A0A5N6YYG7_9EURO|nr:Ferroporti-1 [Aspergillus coremiiformis]